MEPKNQKLNQKSKSKKPQKTQKAKNNNQKVKSVIQTLENKVGKKKKTKVNAKDVIDKVLIFIMVAQLMFLVYYFFGY